MRLNLLAIFLFLYITTAIPLLESRNEGDTLPNPELAEPEPESAGARPGTSGSHHSEADVGPSTSGHEPAQLAVHDHDDGFPGDEEHIENPSTFSGHPTNVYRKSRRSGRSQAPENAPKPFVKAVEWFGGKYYIEKAKQDAERRRRRRRSGGK